MKKIISSLFGAAILVAASLQIHAQGVLVYDQQSATGPSNPSVNDFFYLQEDSPLTQSFIPTLSAIDFVQFEFWDIPNNGNNGATVYVNLWTGSPNVNSPSATLLGSTTPVYMPNGFNNNNLVVAGVADFYFSTSIALTLGQIYYLQPMVLSGDDPWTIMVLTDTYPNGQLYGGAGGFTAPFQPSIDLWFREGALAPVPEPSTLALIGLGSLLVFGFKRRSKLAISLLFAVSVLSVHAAGDSVVKITADEAGLAPATTLPRIGTFWIMTTNPSGQLTALPYPTLPSDLSTLPAYSVAGKIKNLLSNHAHEFPALWLSSLSNLMKYSRFPARLRPNTCNLMPLFQPIFPDSSARPCDARGFFGLKFDGVKVPQSVTKPRSGRALNPIYVLYFV